MHPLLSTDKRLWKWPLPADGSRVLKGFSKSSGAEHCDNVFKNYELI